MTVYALYYKVRKNRLERWDDITEMEPVDMFPNMTRAIKEKRRLRKQNPGNLIKYIIQKEEI